MTTIALTAKRKVHIKVTIKNLIVVFHNLYVGYTKVKYLEPQNVNALKDRLFKG